VELRTARSGRISPRLTDSLTRLGQRTYAWRRAILRGAVALGVVALAGTWFIHVDSDFLYYFDEDSEVRRANEAINREIVGSNPFYLVIDGGQPGALRRWEVLKEVKELQEFLLTLPGITSSISLVDYLELLEAGLARSGEGDLVLDDEGRAVPAPKPKAFWKDPKNLEPVLKLIDLSPATFKSVVTADFAKASVLVRTNLSGSRRI
jgi:predicted RND superfamily exporter protein